MTLSNSSLAEEMRKQCSAFSPKVQPSWLTSAPAESVRGVNFFDFPLSLEDFRTDPWHAGILALRQFSSVESETFFSRAGIAGTFSQAVSWPETACIFLCVQILLDWHLLSLTLSLSLSFLPSFLRLWAWSFKRREKRKNKPNETFLLPKDSKELWCFCA